MGWEWVAPTATSVVGVAGIAATYFAGKRQAESARQVAEAQSGKALALQREERNQRRIETAYPPLLDVLTEGTDWMWQVQAFMLGDSLIYSRRPPPMPQEVQRLVKHGPLTAVWSPHVAELVNEWSRAAARAYANARLLAHQWEEDGKERPKLFDVDIQLSDVLAGRAKEVDRKYNKFESARHVMLSAEARIRQQVWREMRCEDDGYSTRQN